MAQWKAHYKVYLGERSERRVGEDSYLYFNSPDATSMKRAALTKSARNAARKAKAALVKQGHDRKAVEVVSVSCVG
jgi:hypothetical protein